MPKYAPTPILVHASDFDLFPWDVCLFLLDDTTIADDTQTLWILHNVMARRKWVEMVEWRVGEVGLRFLWFAVVGRCGKRFRVRGAPG